MVTKQHQNGVCQCWRLLHQHHSLHLGWCILPVGDCGYPDLVLGDLVHCLQIIQLINSEESRTGGTHRAGAPHLPEEMLVNGNLHPRSERSSYTVSRLRVCRQKCEHSHGDLEILGTSGRRVFKKL